MIFPSYLKPGDTIGITSTARKINQKELQFAISYLEQNGFQIKLASCLKKEENQFAGSDQDRLESFNKFIEDDDIKAILCARGGYGTVRIVDQINWKKYLTNLKWICGYSDVTVIHNRLNSLGVASLHSTMPINFENNTTEALDSFIAGITGTALSLKAESHELNRKGTTSGILTGGNLSIIYSTLGSIDQLDTKGKILFIEDLDEYLYHVDRMMMALKRAGLLSDLAGLVIGGMSDMNDNTIPFGKTAKQIIKEAVSEYNYPVAFDLPVGHLDNNHTLKLGANHMLTVEEETSLHTI